MMHDFFTYLLEVNLSLVILFTAYRILFSRDSNFMVRRTYLLAAMVLPLIIPLLPVISKLSTLNAISLPFQLEEITVIGAGNGKGLAGTYSLAGIIWTIYLGIVGVGIMKLILQLTGIFRAIIRSEKTDRFGIPFYASSRLHASSFFGYIFADSAAADEETLQHILVHEQSHKRQWHSLDRIFTELLVLFNWFNPFAWMFRRCVIENHEFLADSAVLRKGTDPLKYQLSILNQYIGSASIANQFSNQIKNRINMLNRDYRLGSWWKLTVIFPLFFIALIIVSCNEQDPSQEIVPEDQEAMVNNPEAIGSEQTVAPDDLFYIVDEMPAFNGGDPAAAFRQYIANNLRYPEKAAENKISGRVIVQFTVDRRGKVVDPVVVRGVDPLLDNEALRVISSSPDWEPGRQEGKAVNVLFTFPINFALE